MPDIAALALQGLQIVWVNILLSGDNAVVIAMACRGLDARRRRFGVMAGSLAAVAGTLVVLLLAGFGCGNSAQKPQLMQLSMSIVNVLA